MSELRVIVGFETGLHARPAAAFVRRVATCGLPVTIAKEGREPVDAASILQVLTLGANKGDEVILRSAGKDADEVLAQLAAMLSDTSIT